MNTLERAILWRLATTTAVILALMTWIALVVLSARMLTGSGPLTPSTWLRFAQYMLLMLEFAMPVAAGLGLARTMLVLRSSGVLSTVFAAGYRLGRLRVVFVIAGIGSLFTSLALYECSQHLAMTRSEESVPRVWEDDSGFAWRISPVGSDAEYLLFDRSSLRVARGTPSRSTRDSLSVSGARNIVGRQSSERVFHRLREVRDLRVVPALFSSRGASLTWTSAVAWCDRFLWGAICVVLVGYLSILLPFSRSWLVYILVPILVLVSTVAFLRSAMVLWAETAAAGIIDLALLATLGLAGGLFDRWFDRRGLRNP